MQSSSLYKVNSSNRHIVHFDLDSFFVSVERLQNSMLENKPIIIGGTSDRGVVSSCSYEARAYGVHSAMPMKMAKQLCSEAVIIRGDMELYSRYSGIVTDIISEKAPLYEKASIDEFYIDLTGMDKFFGSLKWTKELRKNIIKNSGLPISFGLSINKTVSKIATGESKPNGELQIENKLVNPFLGPLSIKKIPMLGAKTYNTLRSMGVVKIKTLRDVPPELMQNILGKNGLELWKKANGIDNTPVKPYLERKSISTEMTFEQDNANIKMINKLLVSMTEKISFQLRKQQKLTSVITVKIKYTDFNTYTLQKKIPYSSFDHIIMPIVKELFNKLYNKRMLIRLVGIRAGGLVHGTQQLNIFDDTIEQIRLYSELDKIRKRYGRKIIKRASGLDLFE